VALVAVTGDERAATLLEEHVGTHARELLRRLDAGGRGAGSSDEALESEVAELVRATAAARDAQVLETFEQNRGRHEAAVEGIAPVVDALRRAQVETLLISDAAPDEERTLYTAPEPLVLGTSPEEVRALGSEPVRVPASAALLRAAVDSDADVLVVRQTAVDLREGVGASLRYADPSTPSA
jgi:hypothetical protein